MSELRILIVDDERPARDKLRRLLAEQSGVTYVAEARDGVQALAMLAQEKFDALFLDVQMPEMDGLTLAQQLHDPSTHIVFVTAYDQFAVQAFDANAIDYLLKPYDEERFQKAMQKLRKQLALTDLATPAQPPFIIRERNAVLIVPVQDVHSVEAADNYVVLRTATASTMLRLTLSACAQRLGSAYVRCHRSYLVRCDQIARFDGNGHGDGELCLHSGARVPCSRQYRASVLQKVAGQLAP